MCKSSQVKLCLQLTSLCHCASKFSIVPMVMVPLMGRMGLEPIWMSSKCSSLTQYLTLSVTFIGMGTVMLLVQILFDV